MTAYRCNCGWTGDRPSITDDSALRPGPDGTLAMDRRHRLVCPTCFDYITPARPAKEITVNDMTNPSPVLAALESQVEAEARELVQDAIQKVRAFANEQASRIYPPHRYVDRDAILRAAVDTADNAKPRAELIVRAKERLSVQFVRDMTAVIGAAKAPKEAPDQPEEPARPNGRNGSRVRA